MSPDTMSPATMSPDIMSPATMPPGLGVEDPGGLRGRLVRGGQAQAGGGDSLYSALNGS